jgi:hypothetical protein
MERDPYDGWAARPEGSRKRPLEPDSLAYDGVDLGAGVDALSKSEAAKCAAIHYLRALQFAQRLTLEDASFEQTVCALHSVLPGEFAYRTSEALFKESYVAYEREHDTLPDVELDLPARLALGRALLAAVSKDAAADGVLGVTSPFGVPQDLVKGAKLLLQASLLALVQPLPDPSALDTWSISSCKIDTFLDLIVLRGSVEFMGARFYLVVKLDHKPLNHRDGKTALYFSGVQLVPMSSLQHSSEALCFPTAVGQAAENYRQLNGLLQVLFQLATLARLRGFGVFLSADAKALAMVLQMPYTSLWPGSGQLSPIPPSVPFDWGTIKVDIAHFDMCINTAVFSCIFPNTVAIAKDRKDNVTLQYLVNLFQRAGGSVDKDLNAKVHLLVVPAQLRVHMAQHNKHTLDTAQHTQYTTI